MNILYTETFKTEAKKLLTQFYHNAKILLSLILKPPSTVQILLEEWVLSIINNY